MKRNTIYVLLYLTSILFSCNVENINSEEAQVISAKNGKTKNENVIITEGNNTSLEDDNEHCKSVNLIAGQNHIAGSVTIDIDGDSLVLTYTTNMDWTIDATHLHITSCEDEGFPTTGSNNPKIGHFEYSSTHADGVTEVIYEINLSDVTEEFCFAAHAEVSGISEETAWAEGDDFGGNSWAMYVEANLTECENDDDTPSGPF